MAYKHWKDMTEEERTACKTKREEKLKATTELLTKGIKGIITSDAWQTFLVFSSKFYRYSFRNLMLIWMQKPSATLVGSFKFWMKLKRMPRKGTGLEILVPIIKKVDVQDADGNTYQADRCVGFKIGHVFDVSDTDGEPLKENTGISLLKGNDIELYGALCEYAKEKFNIIVQETGQWAGLTINGSCHYNDQVADMIEINNENEPTMKAKTTAHELAHATLHTPAVYHAHNDKSLEELEAESVAFVVMHNFGINSGEYSFLYLASWAGGDDGVKQIEQSGKKIQETARDIITWIEEKYGLVATEDEETEEQTDD